MLKVKLNLHTIEMLNEKWLHTVEEPFYQSLISVCRLCNI